MVIFNPDHDLCLANGDPNFVPPVQAQNFAQQCKWIEKYMQPIDGEYITPWGWNYSLRKRLLKQGILPNYLPSDNQIDFIAQNSRRELALQLHQYLISHNTISSNLVSPEYRLLAESVEEVKAFVTHNAGAVLKVPLSGSGKGIRFVKDILNSNDLGWIRRVLEKYGSIVVEQKQEIIMESAMLFLCTKEGVDFKGYSLFYSVNGVYEANVLASNEYIKNELIKHVPAQVLDCVKEGILEFLQNRFVGNYIGYVGVDQICARDGFIAASEINLRMTMGHIARNIFSLHKDELEFGEATHIFNPFLGINSVQ